ncbi:MAG: ComF family protein [Candidatus Pacebacteria bacterium]|nr:ComF family protein [Candidatus Paceibacterota bacterium]
MLQHSLQLIKELLFPQICAGCGAWFSPLCPYCYNTLSFHILPKTFRLSDNSKMIVWSMLEFDDKVRTLIHRLKYQGMHETAPLLADLLYFATYIPPIDIIVPVPLHQNRQHQRGYNQSELLANRLTHHLQTPTIPALLKIADSGQQAKTHSKTERLQNLIGNFVLAPEYQASISGKRILILDDVLTTGATLTACGEVLLRANPSEILGLTIAH